MYIQTFHTILCYHSFFWDDNLLQPVSLLPHQNSQVIQTKYAGRNIFFQGHIRFHGGGQRCARLLELHRERLA